MPLGLRRSCALLAVVLALAPGAAPAQVFVDVTATALPGIADSPGRDGVPPAFTGGVAVGDCDGDGLPDAYFTGATHDVLYRNRGDGTFEDRTVTANLGVAVGTRGAAFGDVDGDGDLDLVATGYADARHFLLVNDGTCRFTDEGVARGIAVGTTAIGRSASFGDYDRDGWLDLFVTEFQTDLVNPGAATPISHLLRNRGAAAPGFFDDVTVAAGVALEAVVGSQPGTFPFTARFTDLDDDGWPDLAVVADFGESRLFWNDGNGGFVDGTLAAGVGTDEHGMGGTTADLDGDGRLDWFITSIFVPDHPRGTGNRLFRNLGGRAFADVTEAAGVRVGGWGWGTEAFDHDNDGDLDLIMANGVADDEGSRLYAEADLGPIDLSQFVADPLRFWRNDGGAVFTEASEGVGLSEAGIGQGIVTFDYDGDGDLDVLLTHDPAAPRLFRNDGGNANHWIAVELEGGESNRRGIGARVVVTPVGGAPLVQELSGSTTYLAQNGTGRVHFGLGGGRGTVRSIRVEWPSGAVQTARRPPIDGVVRLREACGDRPLCDPTRVQRECITALNGAGARVAAAVARRLVACVRGAARGTSASECLAGDPNGRVAAAEARTATAAASRCPLRPAFGPASAAQVNGGVAGVLRATDLFGPDLDAVLRNAARGTAACQTTVAKGVARLALRKVKAFNRCKAKGLRRGTIASAADLRACYAATAGGAIDRLTARLGRRAAKACARTDLAAALPGKCAGAPADALFACLEPQASCGVCLALDAADGMRGACHRFTDGVATAYCGERPGTDHTVARQWDEELLAAIRRDTPRPTVHARNLFHLSATMWDAWRAYGGGGRAWLTDEAHASDDPDRDRAVAISFAAYRLLSHRFQTGPGAAATQASLLARMQALGFDVDYTATTGDTPAAVGNRIGAAAIGFGLDDGANEAGNYADPTYVPVNQPLVVKQAGTLMADPNRWQPLALDLIITQNGIPQPDKIQTAIGAGWNAVRPFALTRTDPSAVYIDPGPPPQLGGADDAGYKEGARRLLELSSQLDPNDGVTVDISPGALGNNPLGTNDGTGHALNPATGQPYLPNVVKRGDFLRVLAEFWADGPESETPPGHWNVLANEVSDRLAEHRIGGTGPVVGRLEWDVKLYLALNGAVHDAAIVAWGLKRKYDSARPISMIRYLAGRGQSSDPLQPGYVPDGIPLQPGLIEVITPESTAPGERHAHLAGSEGQIAVLAYPGPPPSRTDAQGARWMLGVEWITYQLRTFVSPAFPGFTSGHSTFSRAAAEVMARFTGDAFVPGGLGEYHAAADTYLKNERGPSTDVVLQWATYYDAADQAGISRLAGGIHVAADDVHGRITGSQVGIQAFDAALAYFAGP